MVITMRGIEFSWMHKAQELYSIVWLEYVKPGVLDYFRFDLEQIERCLIFKGRNESRIREGLKVFNVE